jgi:hypothetical protein
MNMNNELRKGIGLRAGLGPWGFPQPMAGGAFDSNLLLFFDAAFNGTSANGTGAAHTSSGEVIGRALNRNAFVTLIAQTPAEGVLTATVFLSLDGTNFDFKLATAELGVTTELFSGQVSVPCSFQGFPWQRYDPTLLKVRATVADSDGDGTNTWGRVSVFLGGQEEHIYGRVPNAADTGENILTDQD